MHQVPTRTLRLEVVVGTVIDKQFIQTTIAEEAGNTTDVVRVEFAW